MILVTVWNYYLFILIFLFVKFLNRLADVDIISIFDFHCIHFFLLSVKSCSTFYKLQRKNLNSPAVRPIIYSVYLYTQLQYFFLEILKINKALDILVIFFMIH